jgi:hypothetical protein
MSASGVSALDVEEVMVADRDYKPLPDLHDLQRELADEAATSDVESCCLDEEREGVMWYDLDSVEDGDKDWLARAVRYLDMRQLLERDPTNCSWVRFRSDNA